LKGWLLLPLEYRSIFNTILYFLYYVKLFVAA